MIKYFTYLVILLLSINSLESQSLFKEFKAKEGYDAAFKQADILLTNDPVPVFVGIARQTINLGVDIAIDFNIEKGTSLAWMYLFKDKLIDTSYVGFLVAKPLIGNYITYTIDAGGILNSGVPINPKLPLTNFTYVDSDIFATKLKNDVSFMSHYNSLGKESSVLVALFVNTDFPVLTPDQPYWSILTTDQNGQKGCAMQAVTQEFQCAGLSVFENYDKLGISIYPNPASNHLNINLPENILISGDIEIYNAYSESLGKFNISQFEKIISLDLSNFDNGYYFGRLTAGNKIINLPFIIIK